MPLVITVTGTPDTLALTNSDFGGTTTYTNIPANAFDYEDQIGTTGSSEMVSETHQFIAGLVDFYGAQLANQTTTTNPTRACISRVSQILDSMLRDSRRRA